MFQPISLSVIIPTLNEVVNLARLIPYLHEHLSNANIENEIIISDAKDTDDGSENMCHEWHVQYIRCHVSSRSAQLAQGAQIARHKVLYFVHADTTPPPSFVDDILNSIIDGQQAGCFAYQFDRNTPVLLKINAWFTQYHTLFTGGGDQGLFIQKETYNDIGGYKSDYHFMEDFQFYKELKKANIAFTIVKNRAIVSNRKYQSNSYIKVQIIQGLLLIAFNLGVPTQRLRRIYTAFI